MRLYFVLNDDIITKAMEKKLKHLYWLRYGATATEIKEVGKDEVERTYWYTVIAYGTNLKSAELKAKKYLFSPGVREDQEGNMILICYTDIELAQYEIFFTILD